MRLLAIEISTASAKTLIYSVGQGVQKVKSISFDKSICDIASQDPGGVFDALVHCIKEIIKDESDDIDAVGICTTWHSLLFLDGNRNPLGRMYTWAHSKASQTVKKYRQDPELCSWFYERTGCMVNSTYPLWQYIHFRDTHYEPCRKACYLSSQQEYVFEKLTGEIAVSRCTASGSGLLNTHTLDWDDEVLEFASIKREQLASLKEPTYAAPLKSSMAKELGLTPGIPVIIGGADGALNQIGDGGIKEGIMTMSVGTSGAIRLVSNEVVLPSSPSTWCYYLAEGKHIVGGSTAGAGNCLEWFVDKMSFGSKLSYKDLDEAVKHVNIDNAPFFLPFLYGERCPGWLDNRLGGFLELSSEHGMVDMYYAVLEGVLFNLYHCYTFLTELMVPPKKILISGGIVRSGFWTQMVADIFKKEMNISNIEHVSLLGVVALMLKSLNLAQDLGQIQLDCEDAVSPNQEIKDIYRRRFERYKALYSSVK
jgi:gluconokinase